MGREYGDMVRGRGAEELAAVMWEAAPSFCPVCTLFCPDSKLQEELSALRETFSNLTVSTEAKVKALSVQGEEGWGWGAGNSRAIETLSKSLP